MKNALLLFAIAFHFMSCAEKPSKPETANSVDTTPIPVMTTSSVTQTVTSTSGDTTEYDASRKGKDGQVAPQNGDTVRFMVSFISKGFGIDTKSKAHFEKWCDSRADIQYTASPWGREGEMSYCFPLKNKSAAEQEAFMRDAKNELPNRDLVVFSENIPCEKRR